MLKTLAGLTFGAMCGGLTVAIINTCFKSLWARFTAVFVVSLVLVAGIVLG